MKKQSSTRFIVIALVVLGIAWCLIALFVKNYWLLLLGAAWLIMPFTISFTYKEPDPDDEEEDDEDAAGHTSQHTAHTLIGRRRKTEKAERKDY